MVKDSESRKEKKSSMGYVPSEYDKYFSFGLMDYSEFDINIEPPIPPPLPQNSSHNNNQESAQGQDQISESITENSEFNQESIVKDQEIMPEQNQDENLSVEVDGDMNYCFDIVNYSLYPECTNIEEVTECEDSISVPDQDEVQAVQSCEENIEEHVEGSDFDKIPMEVGRSNLAKRSSNDYLKLKNIR